MIKNVMNLFQTILDKEREIISGLSDVKHSVLSGDMWEGLTKKLTNLILPAGHDIKIVDGLIKFGTDTSHQIDCMIVVGDGQRMANTDHYLYDSRQVLAIIEVKKDLYSDELADSIPKFDSYARKHVAPDLPRKMFEDPWRQMTGKQFPSLREVDTKLSSEELRLFYHSFVTEISLPVRIVLGYGGFKSECRFRKAFLDWIAKNKGCASVVALPNLIISGDYCLVKLNGAPYCGEYSTDINRWTFYASTRNPVEHFIEVIWTRLTYLLDISSTSLFGTEVDLPPMNVLLFAKPLPAQKGWALEFIDAPKKMLNETIQKEKWKPYEVSNEEFVILNELCRGNQVLLTDPAIVDFLTKRGLTVESLFQSLNGKNLVDKQDDELTLLTDQMMCVVHMKKFWVGDNRDGRMKRWLDEQTCPSTAACKCPM